MKDKPQTCVNCRVPLEKDSPHCLSHEVRRLSASEYSKLVARRRRLYNSQI